VAAVFMVESLPRGRDGADLTDLGGGVGGITPARAGRSRGRTGRRGRMGNHSRAGGTELRLHEAGECHLESLPRGRDGGDYCGTPTAGEGITPARAGRSMLQS